SGLRAAAGCDFRQRLRRVAVANMLARENVRIHDLECHFVSKPAVAGEGMVLSAQMIWTKRFHCCV
ncbi:MAG TPA: hypothetical protein VGO25_08875, partial [Rhodanobacteraceae bacterium]|nr:hypothetical protein [Rhodanobacteraceae bacterium]